MSKIMYFYADSAGDVRPNDSILPLDVIRKMSGKNVFRFAYDQDENKIYVQDASFREKLGKGDDVAWRYANEAMRYLRSSHGATFMDRAYGDPLGDAIVRKLSDYPSAWEALSSYLKDEFGSDPIDVEVVEHASQSGSPVRIAKKGEKLGPITTSSPSLAIDRTRCLDKHGDVSFASMGDVLSKFYLEHLREIAGSRLSKDMLGKFESVWSRYSSTLDQDLLFAVMEDGKTKIYKARTKGNGDPLDERTARESGMSGHEHIVFFRYSPKENVVALKNYSISEMQRVPDLRRLMRDIVSMAARASGSSEKDIMVVFSPSLGAPFVSKLRRYHVLWELAGDSPRDIVVLEAPLGVREGAMVVESSKDEDDAAGGARDFRVKHGLHLEYPFMLVDNRIKSAGLKLRAMKDAYDAFVSDKSFVGSAAENPRMVAKFLLSMGYSKTDAIDFLAARDRLPERAETRRMVGEVIREMKKVTTAAIGPSMDTNDWSYVDLQESLNRARHQNPPKAEPFNMRKKKVNLDKSKSYEELLDKDRDKNAGYMKTTEQLLRESRV